MEPMGVGVVGCGNIAPIYLKNLAQYPETRLVAVSDLDLDRAKSRANEFGVPKCCTVEELLQDDEIGLVLNLTTPGAHYAVAKQAIQNGKHVYNEKPLTIKLEDADELLALAKSVGVKVGCAPDTVLGAGIQTCRDVLDRGEIGRPLSFQAFMMCPGHEGWHPDPAFYYHVGGGPLFDMGPYYMSALVTLLGPVRRVCGFATKAHETRTIGSAPKRGETIRVEVPTHLVTAMEFASGAVGQLTTSFDVQFHTLPHIEIYGENGTIRVPDPNGFGGPVFVRTKGDSDWREVSVTRPFSENSRGLGVRDLVQSLHDGTEPKAGGALARHILAVFHAAHAEKYTTIEPASRPDAMPNEA